MKTIEAIALAPIMLKRTICKVVNILHPPIKFQIKIVKFETFLLKFLHFDCEFFTCKVILT